MDRKEIIRAFVYFVGGIVISVVGLSILDINQASATNNIAPTRANVAQRASLPTRTLSVDTLEPSTTPDSGEAIVPFSAPPATSTSEPSPTAGVTLEPSATSTVVATTTPTVRRIVTLNGTATPTTTATPNKKGDSPFSAQEMTDTWQKLASGASIWFKFGRETSFPMGGSVWLDASVDENGRRGISLAVFSPDQSNDLNSATTPKGRASYDWAQPGHALFWKGQSPVAGIWHAYLRNNNSFPLDYKIANSFNATDRKNCVQYWESLPPSGAIVLWTKCD
jgi:hypothetical protein